MKKGRTSQRADVHIHSTMKANFLSHRDNFPVQQTNPSVDFAIVNGLLNTDCTSQQTSARDICQMHDRDRCKKEDGDVRPLGKHTLESKAFE